CGLTTIGSIICWGADDVGQADVPTPPLGSIYTAVSVGYRHTCALTSLRQVVCWGINDVGQATPPPAIQSLVTQISSGNDFSCALTLSGLISCWGRDNYHQSSPPPPPPGTQYTAVSAGGVFACGLTNDQNAICWGDIPVPAVGPLTQLTTGAFDACGLTPGLAVFCWGSDATHGQINVPPGHTLVALSAGMFHMCGLTIESRVICWGWNDGPDGQTTGQVSDAPPGTGFTALASGGYHSCALTVAGLVTCWGDNAAHQVDPAPGTPAIDVQPTSQTLILGATLTLSVGATSHYFVGNDEIRLPMSYQWFRDGRPITNATAPALTLTDVDFADAGRYTVAITNEFGTTTSAPAIVSVSYGIRVVPISLNIGLAGRGVLLGIQLVDANGDNRSSPTILVNALNIAPGNQPWDGQQPNDRVPFLYEPRITRSPNSAGYLLLINTRRLTPDSYTLTFQAGDDPTLHTVEFRVR
ncbi:MAG TPA: hypothetical protein VF201_01875, partial [Nitrolancea sp.]